MKKLILLPVLIIALMAFTTEPNQVNDTIDNFSLVNAVDNSTVSLSDFAKAKAVVIIFTSPACAYCKVYEDRLVQLAKEYEGREVQFMFINPNSPSASPEDNPSAMAKKAKEKAYNFPYLIDSNQKIANKLGATKTPEAFVLKNVNGKFVIKYKGAIDDNPQLASDVRANYVKDAVNSVLSNTTVKITEKRATGCMIKK